MPSITAVIITFNEEKNIKRCLSSLTGLVDEIVVVDSFSVDATPSICENFKVQFVQKVWEGYTKAKNMGNALAQSDYILSIDADEALSDELKMSLLNVKQNAVFDAYQLNRLTNYCGHWIKHSGWYPEKRVRLWKKGSAEWQGEIHENVVFQQKTNLGELRGDLLHYSFYSIADHLQRVDKYTTLMAKDHVSRGKKASLFKVLVSPAFKFFQSYVLQLGFLDGYYGFVVCMLSAHATFVKYLKIREIQK